MKLILLFSTFVTFFGAWLWSATQSLGLFPALRSALDTIAATGITDLPRHMIGISRELLEIVQTHDLNIWHGVLIVLAVLLARKAVMWILH